MADLPTDALDRVDHRNWSAAVVATVRGIGEAFRVLHDRQYAAPWNQCREK